MSIITWPVWYDFNDGQHEPIKNNPRIIIVIRLFISHPIHLSVRFPYKIIFSHFLLPAFLVETNLICFVFGIHPRLTSKHTLIGVEFNNIFKLYYLNWKRSIFLEEKQCFDTLRSVRSSEYLRCVCCSVWYLKNCWLDEVKAVQFDLQNIIHIQQFASRQIDGTLRLL